MAGKHHYVSKFHLKHFTSIDSLQTKDPWLWLGLIQTSTIKKRAPKNFAISRGMFDGPGGLSNSEATLESYLATEVEGPAATALINVLKWPVGSGGELPAPLSRYLAWAAARSLPMKALEQKWALECRSYKKEKLVEQPLIFGEVGRERDIRMFHETHGVQTFAAIDTENAVVDGWLPDLSEHTNFLESIHIQAYYFQKRFFPRFSWSVLHAPKGEYFIIGDRPVGWVADGVLDAPPSSLRHPSTYILAPISRCHVLVGRYTAGAWNVTPREVNAVTACLAHDWIAGPTESAVKNALNDRGEAMS